MGEKLSINGNVQGKEEKEMDMEKMLEHISFERFLEFALEKHNEMTTYTPETVDFLKATYDSETDDINQLWNDTHDSKLFNDSISSYCRDFAVDLTDEECDEYYSENENRESIKYHFESIVKDNGGLFLDSYYATMRYAISLYLEGQIDEDFTNICMDVEHYIRIENGLEEYDPDTWID